MSLDYCMIRNVMSLDYYMIGNITFTVIFYFMRS